MAAKESNQRKLRLLRYILYRATGDAADILSAGFFHNVGQLVAAIFFADNLKLVNYLPVLVVCGIFVGASVGYVAFAKILARRKGYSQLAGNITATEVENSEQSGMG